MQRFETAVIRPVGVVYDRAYFVELKGKRAVIDRAYRAATYFCAIPRRGKKDSFIELRRRTSLSCLFQEWPATVPVESNSRRTPMRRLLVQTAVAICGLWCFSTPSFSQAAPADTSASESSTSTDLFIMLGSDFVRPRSGNQSELQHRIGSHVQISEKGSAGRRGHIRLYIRECRFARILPHLIWFSYRSAGHHEELRTSADQGSYGLYVDSAWPDEHDRKCICSELSLQRRVGRINRSFQRPSFRLDSGNIQ